MSDIDPTIHPGGQPNRTPVNPSNPIFGIPADPIPADVSIGQAAIAQNAPNPGPSVQSPLINEGVEDSPAPVVEPEPEPAPEPEQPVEPEPVPEPETEEGIDQGDGSNTPAAGLTSAEDLDAAAAEQLLAGDPAAENEAGSAETTSAEV